MERGSHFTQASRRPRARTPASPARRTGPPSRASTIGIGASSTGAFMAFPVRNKRPRVRLRDYCCLIKVADQIGPKDGRTTMTLMTRTRLDIVPLTKHIGAEIRGFDLRQKPDGDTIKASYQAWRAHIVSILPEQE